MTMPTAPGSPRVDASGTTADRLLTANEVAAMLSVPVRWVREHSRSGLLPVVALGRYRRYRRDAVLTWVEQQETGGAAWRRHKPVPRGGTK
jgi:excisionase family DNA binding protein